MSERYGNVDAQGDGVRAACGWPGSPGGIAAGSADPVSLSAHTVSVRPDSASVRPDTARRAVRSAGLGVWEWDVPTQRLVWDKRTAEILGVDVAHFDASMEEGLACVHPADRKVVTDAMHRAVACGGSYCEEFRIMRPDGSTGWALGQGCAQLDAAGRTVALLGVVSDSTHLRTARERAVRALEHASDGLAVLDTHWLFVFANAAAARLLVRGSSQLVGTDLWCHLPEATADELAGRLHEALQAQEAVTLEACFGPDQGWYEIRAMPAPDGLTLYFRSIDERRSAEAERISLAARLGTSLDRGRDLEVFTSALAEAVTLDEVGMVVGEHTTQGLGARFAGPALLSDDNRYLRFVTLHPLPGHLAQDWSLVAVDVPSPLTDVVRSRQALFHDSRQSLTSAYPDLAKAVAEAGTAAFANLPLVVSGELIGVLSLAWAEERRFTDEERAYLTTLANHCALAVGRARLFDRQQAVAETLQRAILPERLPSAAGLELAATYLPAGSGVDVGGDWYDAFTLADGLVGLVVGDVGGHGIKAAAVMGQLRNALRAYALDGYGPGEVMDRLDRLLVANDDDVFATCVYATFDPVSRRLSWCNAGHPPLLVCDSGARESFLDTVHGTLLGAGFGPYASSETVLAPHSLLLAYTDGLVEHRSWSLDRGMAQLASAVRAAFDDDLGALGERITRSVLSGVRRDDDLCVLAARVS